MPRYTLKHQVFMYATYAKKWLHSKSKMIPKVLDINVPHKKL